MYKKWRYFKMENMFLYPCESETRQVIDLSGIWNFQVDFENEGRKEDWYQGLPHPTQVPVPASYNDLFILLFPVAR